MGRGRGDGEDQVHAERDHEELLTAKPVGEVTEEERTHASANRYHVPAEAAWCVVRWSVWGFVRTLAIAPTSVTSNPSRIQVIPRPTTTKECQRLQGRQSRRLGIIVSTVCPVAPRSRAVVAELMSRP